MNGHINLGEIVNAGVGISQDNLQEAVAAYNIYVDMVTAGELRGDMAQPAHHVLRQLEVGQAERTSDNSWWSLSRKNQ